MPKPRTRRSRKRPPAPRGLHDYTPAPWNPRTISPEALAGLAASLGTFGDLSGFVFNERTGSVICGHARREAFGEVDLSNVRVGPPYEVELGPAGAKGKPFVSRERSGYVTTPAGARFPVRLVRWSRSFERAANVAANSPALQGRFTDQLDPLLGDLRRREPGIYDALLFDALRDLAGGAPQEGLTDPDAIPHPPAKASTRRGDVYELPREGKTPAHRLLCGDSAAPADVDRLLDGGLADLACTDPPYNVNVQPRTNNAIARAGKRRKHHQQRDLAAHPEKAKPTGRMRARDRQLINDFLPAAEFEALLKRWFGGLARALTPGGSFYIWGGYMNCSNYPPALEAAGLFFAQSIIWHKQHPVLTRKDFMGDHEWCFYGWKKGAAHWFNPRITNLPDVWDVQPELANPTDFWSVRKVNPRRMVHLTEKPVELARRAMRCSTRPGAMVLDLFGGSGSTLIAAEQMGRRACLMELDPPYCDVIVRRWEEFTGRKARRRTRKGKR